MYNWPALPLKELIRLSEFEFILKAKDTSETLREGPVTKEKHLQYQFYYNQSSKLIGYKFVFDQTKNKEKLPRITLFDYSIMASYIPEKKVANTQDIGTLFVPYHDLNIRLFKYTVPEGETYNVVLRTKLKTF